MMIADADSRDMLETAYAEDNDELASRYVNLSRTIEISSEERGRIEWELVKRMEQEEATRMDLEKYEVDLSYTTEWREEMLPPLREHISPERWAKAVIPEKVIPSKLDKRVVKSWSRLGGAVADIIAKAQFRGKPKFSITQKGPF